MVDTIVLELHDLKKHVDIVREISQIRKGINKYDVHKHGGTLRHTITEFVSEEGAELGHTFTYKAKNQPSSHYKVIFMMRGDSVVINFSVPKYYYGQNITQAVTTPFENEILLRGTTDTIDYQLERGFERLIKYVESFFFNEFPHCDVDWTQLELKRIDMCFNQIFRTKAEAFIYLKYQKQRKRKYYRESGSGDIIPYKESIFYSCKDYSYKIYHKGSEYTKNDMVEHLKINRREDKIIFDTDYLQKFSDRILRYEFTFRQSYISYLYNQHLFRNQSKNFRKFRQLYNGLKAAYDKEKDTTVGLTENSIDYFFNSISSVFHKQGALKIENYEKNITNFLFDWYTKKANEEQPTKHEVIRVYRKFFKDFDNLMNTRRSFFFVLSEENETLHYLDNRNNKNFLSTESYVPFEKNIYSVLGKKFKDFVHDFQIERKSPTNHYLERIEEYNKKIKGRRDLDKLFIGLKIEKKREKLLDKSKLGMVLMCLENYDLKDVQSILNLDRTTIYRYTKQLEKIGYTKHTVGDDVNFPVNITFQDYFNETLFNKDKFFISSPLMFDFITNPLESVA